MNIAIVACDLHAADVVGGSPLPCLLLYHGKVCGCVSCHVDGVTKLFAIAAIGIGAWTENPNIDAYGSIGIGILLGLVAVFLIIRNRRLLIGEAVSGEDKRKLIEVLSNDPLVERVIMEQSMVTGTDSYLVSAEVDLDDGVGELPGFAAGVGFDEGQLRVVTHRDEHPWVGHTRLG